MQVFDAYWVNEFSDHAVSVPVARAIAERLLAPYSSGRTPTVDDYERALAVEGLPTVSGAEREGLFSIPDHLEWQTGKYSHQGEAVRRWEESGRQGVLCMATGAGKTLTSLIAACRLWEYSRCLFVLVAVPTLPLVTQWAEEMAEFGLTPYRTLGRTGAQHVEAIGSQLEYLEFGVSTIESAVVTHDFLKRPDFKTLIARNSSRVLFIADEMHNLGTGSFIHNPPNARYKLGLSATPERQYDDVGTQRLLAYFGDVVFEFGLRDAIGVCLVPYRYSIHPVELDQDENDDYIEVSAKIRQSFAREADADSPSESTQRLLEKRRRILESARGKVGELERLIADLDPTNLRHTLIYCSDKDSRQISAVNDLLLRLGVRFHQVTSVETQDRRGLERTIASFRSGSIQCLTAMRVLDEGFNLPEITTAYILASTTVRRQWVQRRGRILRICRTVDKPYADVHDFVVLPPANAVRDADARGLVKKELERCDEFAQLAMNRDRPGGPAEIVQEMETEYVMWMDI
nr:DEAD/DEAH box helicase [Gordonia jinghuaiqii]